MGGAVRRGGRKQKSMRQVRFLLSKVSPLSKEQKNKLKNELHSGEVTVNKRRRRISNA